jgi:hypothetical protein
MMWNPWGKRVNKISFTISANGLIAKETVSAEHRSQCGSPKSASGLPQEFTSSSSTKSVSFI